MESIPPGESNAIMSFVLLKETLIFLLYSVIESGLRGSLLFFYLDVVILLLFQIE